MPKIPVSMKPKQTTRLIQHLKTGINRAKY